MRDLILSLKEKHTVILSSHILSEITRTCDRILVIDQGRLVAEGTESDLRGKAEDEFDVRLEVDGDIRTLSNQLQSLEGVIAVTFKNSSTAALICSKEIRPALASLVHQSGLGLLTLERRQAELETLFLKLVRGDKA